MRRERPAFDRMHLLRQCGGDEALAREILSLFLGQCDRLPPAIGRGGAEAADAAHTLRGAASAVGAWTVAAEAGRLEDRLRTEPSLDEGGPELAPLHLSIAALRRALAEQV